MTSKTTPAFESLRQELSGRYAFEGELGRSAAAEVYVARDLKHDRRVVVKVRRFDAATAGDPEAILHELRVASSLQHPSILTLLDSGFAAGLLYTVTPSVEDGSLWDLLRWKKTLPLADALRLAGELAGALAAAHDAGLVHGAVSPEHVLLSSGHAVLAGFGSSARQAEGVELDGRADVYGLGSLLYEMLAGRPPFTGPTAEIVAARQREGVAPSLDTIRPDVPPALARVVAKSLAADPARRFASAGEMLGELLPLSAAAELDGSRRRVPTAPSGTKTLPMTRPAGWRTLTGATASWPRGWPVARAAAALLLLGFVLGVPGQAMSRRLSWDRASSASIAALPLDYLGGDAAGASLSEGVTEEIGRKLSAIEGLRVASRTSATVLAGRGLTTRELGRELNVSFLLEGTVQISHGRVRLTLRVVDAATDAAVWVGSYEREVAEPLRMQEKLGSEIAITVAEAVQVDPSR